MIGGAMRAMAVGRPGGGTNILPTWLAIVWTAVFVAVLAIHSRHAVQSRGQRRLWHAGHVLTALGMAFMYVPSSLDPFQISSRFWQIAFLIAALAIAGGLIGQVLRRRPINALWPMMAVDAAAMAYMWSATLVVAVSWLLAGYLGLLSALWISDRIRSVDRRLALASYAVTPEGAIGSVAAQPLICYRDLRVSMGAMTLGMAYMLAAVALLAG